MDAHLDIVLHKMRFVIAAVLVVGNLFLLSALTSVISTNTVGKTPAISTSRPAATFDSPNAVTSGMGTMLYDVGQAAGRASLATNSFLGNLGRLALQGGKFVGSGLRSGFMAVAYGTARSITFLVHLPGNIIGSVGDTAVVSAVIKPTGNTKIPIIDPNVTAIGSVSAALPPAQIPIQVPSSDSTAAWPIHGVITTEYGVPHWPYQPTHTGLDISDGQRSGVTPIHPFKPGKVVDAIHSYSGLGNHIIVDHGNGLVSVYGHLASIAVQPGQNVNKTTVLGYEGSTGASTGTHLHFEVRLNGQYVDPRNYVSGQP